ncbi:sulfate/molybdate ABC transporter ATP-binding protein [Methylocystis sp. SB2]|uniref:sulfate/molybdate ABC transporter ATP-binding protein n=1 Tax=Methylocystis sp. (strain SB2) TaxID=743836 RepID=UPI0004233E2C|nr:sulfate/molybdate ABC transporter ATP-binding protein [Methylocystis sp. SB2]ULO23355.1 sulfate/molybdate ABC transporter ATP-binding protein [Methylocystis sp. SB2]
MLTRSPDALAATEGSKRGTSIRIEGVEQDFGAFPALRDVSLDIQPGELVALLGPSGSGKTTLLRVIAGLNSPDRGRILFDGENATNLPVQDRHVGMVFQNYALFKHMTVADNIAYGLRVRPRRTRPSRAAIKARVAELLQFVQLDGLGGRYPAQLSGGQRQRVALARALAIEPRVLLLDEPFGALDARVRKDLRRWLRDIHKQTGLTTVFVTHDQDEAMELADRVVVLNEGRIEQIGTPEELYDRPASPFVISFVGEAVALPVTIAGGHVTFGGRELHIDTHGLRSGPARVFFRPADIAVAAEGNGDLEGRVESLRRTPAGVRATIAIDGYDQTLEIDSPLDRSASLAGRVPLSLAKARIFPADENGDYVNAGDGI